MYLFEIYFLSFLVVCPGVGFLDHMVALFLVSKKPPHCSPYWLHQFTFPPTAKEDYGFIFWWKISLTRSKNLFFSIMFLWKNIWEDATPWRDPEKDTASAWYHSEPWNAHTPHHALGWGQPSLPLNPSASYPLRVPEPSLLWASMPSLLALTVYFVQLKAVYSNSFLT